MLKMTRLRQKLRNFYSDMLFYWFAYFKSQPITVSEQPALIVSPHQDDESLGCGGVIALKRSLGVPVKVIFLTDGQRAFGRNALISAEELIQIRKQESLEALRILGLAPTDVFFLDIKDGSLARLSQEQSQQLTHQIHTLITTFDIREVYVPFRQDGHSDHEAAYQLVTSKLHEIPSTIEVMEYPIWFFQRTKPWLKDQLKDAPALYRLSISGVQEKKKQAIDAYRSQVSQLKPGLPTILPQHFLKRFLVCEIFFRSSITATAQK
jgi:N-acetylglucosamine malate deacetylase 1